MRLFNRPDHDQSRNPDPNALKSTEAFSIAASTTDPLQRLALLEEARTHAEDSSLARTYDFLLRVVGLIVFTLPPVLIVGNDVLFEDGLHSSLSGYYYTHMGDYFVGAMFALGVFFFSYNHDPLPKYEHDKWWSNLAAVLAIGVALFPTKPPSDANPDTVGVLHLVFAGLLLALLAYFSLGLFTKTGDPNHMNPGKKRRNVVYRICGVIIVASLVVTFAAERLDLAGSSHLFLWLESLAVMAFGFSWLVKGGLFGLLADA